MAQVHHNFEQRNHRLRSSVARNIRKTGKRSTAISAVRAELIGANTATALDVEANGPSPVVTLCGDFLRGGHDPAMSLHAYRGNTLALKVRSIGEGARLTVEANPIGKPVFRRWRDRAESNGAAPPVASTA